MPSARQRPFTVATVLFARDEADTVREFLEAIAPDQSLAFLLLEEDGWSDDERHETRSRAFGASRFRNESMIANGVVEPNAVYFLARGRAKALLDGELHLKEIDEHSGARTVASEFFTSIAGDQGQRACVIILAGSRVDADTHGSALDLIVEANGLVLVQEENGGAFRRLVKARSDSPDEATLVEQRDVANVVMEHAEPLIAEARPRSTTELYREVETILPELCKVLHDVTGHDFSQYKSSTLIRRTLRRLHLLHIESAPSYVERLRSDASEVTRLFDDLLVNVTSFFRDPEAFQALRDLVVPRLFDPQGRVDPVRIWVAGCASGEEAYTIAILIREYAETAGPLPQVQIFATDLDETALSRARRGRYAPARLANVSSERLAKFFTRSGKEYQITKEIREMVMFTRHSVTSDPPFSNLDLVSCRNLLIYLGDELHRRVIPLFHYALRPKGYLFLGPSESISPHTDLFRSIDAKHRISERLRVTKRHAPFVQTRTTKLVLNKTAESNGNADAEILRTMQRALAEDFTPRGVVVTDEGHIVATSGNLEAFVTVSAGSFVNSVTRLVREGLRVAVRSALREAVSLRARAVHTGATLNTTEGVQRVTITVQPFPATSDMDGLYLVVFQPVGLPVSPSASPTPQHTEAANALIERLELDLNATRDELQRTVQDLEAANEELKSSNEELLSMNEELQSTNEELESSKEDLEGLNGALEDTNNDLTNLLSSTGIPTIFLDEKGNVRRTTPGVETIYNLRVEDVGRPLSHFTHRAVQMPSLPSPQSMVHAHRAVEHEIEMLDGAWYTRRVLPYITPEGHTEGTVVTFIDLTERRRYEAELRESEARLRSVIDSMFAFVGVLDIDGTLLEVNQAPLGGGRMRRDEVIGLHFWDCAWFAYDSQVRERLRDAFSRAQQGEIVRYDEVVATAAGKRIHIDFMLQPVYRDAVLQFVIPSAVDVTHRVLAEERLRYQRNITQTITDNATTAVFMTDANRLCTFANPAAEAMTGYTMRELTGHRLHDMIHHTRPDGSHYPADECSLDRALPQNNQIRNHEDVFVRKDGSFFPVVCSASLIFSGGEAAGLVVEVRDVTQEKIAARAVADSQERFRQLAESIPQLAWMAHPDGNIFWYNQRWYDYTGTTLEEMRDWGWKAVHDPDVLPAVVERWSASLATGRDFDMVFPIRAANGSFRPFLTRVYPFRNENDEIVLWFGSNTDISEERERADTLRKRQRELQTLTDNSPDVLTRFDREYRHVFVNGAVERATGLPPSAFLGKTNRELGMPTDQCDAWEEVLDRVFATGEEQTLEFEFDSPTGRRYFIGRFVPELGANGEIQFALGFTRDRTAERVAEDAVHDANRRKDEFLATLAHELRNPLAPLRNGLEILRLTDNVQPIVREIRDVMERQVVTMTRLIDDLLDISRISLGKVELKRSQVSLRGILEAAAEVSKPSLQGAHHEFIIESVDDSLMLNADATRLAQVIGNLLHNAAKYTPERGRIVLAARRVGKEAHISVTDNGVGIPKDMLTRVFDMFTQIAYSSTRSQGGLGIGLALVRQLVEMHGGSVSAASEGSGKGSTFTVKLPLDSAVAAEPIYHGDLPQTVDADRPEALNILVVDDNIDAALSLTKVLKMMGHQAQSAFNGAEALHALATTVPDFIFLDIGLPDTSGYELAATIRQDARLDRAIVVALTGWGSNDHRRRSVEAGFDYHLTKPADVAIIKRILDRAVR